MKILFVKEGKIQRKDFPVVNLGSCVKSHTSISKKKVEIGLVYDKFVNQQQMVNIAIQKAIEAAQEEILPTTVSIRDKEHRYNVLAVVKYYPKGYDENKKPVPYTLEVKVKDPNIDPFETIYAQKNELYK